MIVLITLYSLSLHDYRLQRFLNDEARSSLGTDEWHIFENESFSYADHQRRSFGRGVGMRSVCARDIPYRSGDVGVRR
jgi:hypothetical protein